ncbi:MAG TPA: prolyl oligopeptidase family serine peptidase [Gemmatimonadaceae bacterium]|nr:prolyl oligopeptidase family serine peptidase [Gemmatimonadaceae bacterium]
MLRVGSRFTAVLSLFAMPLVAQQQSPPASVRAPSGAARPVFPASEWDRLETINSSVLSPDGKWLAYELVRVSGGTELRYGRVGSPDQTSVQLGQGGEFTSNSRWLVYSISSDTTRARRQIARRRRGPGGLPRSTSAADSIHDKVGIVDLRSGKSTVLEDVRSFAVSEDGSHVALRLYPARGAKRQVADLVVRDLASGTHVTFGNVREYEWSDDGALLAMTIEVDGGTGNAVQVLDASTGRVISLDAGGGEYRGLAWRESAHDLAAYRSREDSAFADTSYVVLAWRNVGSSRSNGMAYDFSADSHFPSGMAVAAYEAPLWSADGGTLFFGMREREAKQGAARGEVPPESAKPARVEVWHWKDLREYHQQDREASRDRERTLMLAWKVGGRSVVPLADDYHAELTLADSGSRVVRLDDNPYFDEIISGRSYRDVYAVDVATGKSEKVITHVAFDPVVSPTGRYLLYVHDGQWWSYDRETAKTLNLTGVTGVAFVDTLDDHPVAEHRPYGVEGWTSGEKSVLLADRFDLWQVRLDGTPPQRLTRGREDSTVYRVEQLDTDAHTIDSTSPIWLSATGEYSRKSGFARLDMGKPVRRVLWLDKGATDLAKAEDAEVFTYVVQSYEDSPDLFVTTGGLDEAKQASHTNAVLADYAWGKQDLLNYVNSRGDTLQMMLTYPANYEPGRKYPMVVYYYEKLSQGFNRFVIPSDRSLYNVAVFSNNGYFVLRPDIRFTRRNPGFSGLDCVAAAVKTVLATGMVDPKRVGNMGHSWGGYQSAFYAVHGHGLFAATIAGAPLTDLISMYGYTSFNTGRAETGHFETGQERMQVPLWEDPGAYIRNSTVFAVDSLRTPLLIEEGDADGNVNYWQGMELYNFGRRLGKKVVFLIYNDENHGVARPESQRDYHTRQLEWFAHFLKGEPAADWIANGESYLDRQKLIAADSAARKRRGSKEPRATAVEAGGGSPQRER